MQGNRAEFWDAMFAGDRYVYGTEPNSFLRGQAFRLRPGMRALTVGDGEGRNGVWLAQQGLSVTSIDLSAVGIDKARRLAAARGVAIEARQGDVADADWAEASFDVVASIFLHLPPDVRPRVHAALARALRPGGLLVLEGFHRRQLGRSSGGPKELELLFDLEDLRRDFAALEPLEALEGEVLLDEGDNHRGLGAVVRLLARKP